MKGFRCSLYLISFLFSYSTIIGGCSEKDDIDKQKEATSVSITGNVTKYGATFAFIEGYVNLSLVTSSYTNPQIGVEISTEEDFSSYYKRVKTKELEGNKITICAERLSGNCTYYYRTFVQINEIIYYGEKKSFKTKDFNNITSVNEVCNIMFSSAFFKLHIESTEGEELFKIGIAYSLNEHSLNADSTFNTIAITTNEIETDSCDLELRNLQVGHKYYYCPFTTDGNVYKLGKINSFSTDSIQSSILSANVDNVTTTSADIEVLSHFDKYLQEDSRIQVGVRYSTQSEMLNNPAPSLLSIGWYYDYQWNTTYLSDYYVINRDRYCFKNQTFWIKSETF